MPDVPASLSAQAGEVQRLTPLVQPTPVVVDTDPGLSQPGSDVDHGFAIALALRSPELEVRGLTIVNGNVDALTGFAVARRLCERLGRRDLPVRLGALAPL